MVWRLRVSLVHSRRIEVEEGRKVLVLHTGRIHRIPHQVSGDRNHKSLC